jgi:uncharacterized membrane protein
MTMRASPDDTSSDGHRRPLHRRLRRWVLPARPPAPVNPALLKHSEARAEDAQNRIADWITAFAGSMRFVYIHIVWFGCWIGFGVERYPFGLLTMIVSLEAIFLSTFVMISQNRADAKRQVLADQQWRTVQEEERQNGELLKLSSHQDQQNKDLLHLSNQILALTKEVRTFADMAREDQEHNKQLLDLSRRTFALTEEVHTHTGAGGPTAVGLPGAGHARTSDS